MIEGAAAIEIARARASVNGWAFAEPIQLVHRPGWSGSAGQYEIETNAGKLGTKTRFVIDASTGAIVSEGYIPR